MTRRTITEGGGDGVSALWAKWVVFWDPEKVNGGNVMWKNARR